MTNERKEHALWTLVHEQRELQQLERGEWPEWTSYLMRTSPLVPLEKRRELADWCLKAILKALIPTLPKALRVWVQTCFDLRERIWSNEYTATYFQAQKETSPASLPALDSF